MFKRKYRFKRVKLAWHHQNRFNRKLVLFLRFSLKSNFWKSHVAITHINTHTHTAADTMPCAAAGRCAVPDDTPGPPRFTNLFDITCLNEQSRNNDGHEGSSDGVLSEYPTVYCGIL